MGQTKYTIRNVTGQKDDSDLIGCYFKQAGTGFELWSPGANGTKLATVSSLTPPINIPFNYAGWSWNITVNSASPPAGSWSNNDPSITAEAGTWSTDTGTDEEIADSATTEEGCTQSSDTGTEKEIAASATQGLVSDPGK